jgi:hypothetical protein
MSKRNLEQCCDEYSHAINHMEEIRTSKKARIILEDIIDKNEECVIELLPNFDVSGGMKMWVELSCINFHTNNLLFPSTLSKLSNVVAPFGSFSIAAPTTEVVRVVDKYFETVLDGVCWLVSNENNVKHYVFCDERETEIIKMIVLDEFTELYPDVDCDAALDILEDFFDQMENLHCVDYHTYINVEDAAFEFVENSLFRQEDGELLSEPKYITLGEITIENQEGKTEYMLQ